MADRQTDRDCTQQRISGQKSRANWGRRTTEVEKRHAVNPVPRLSLSCLLCRWDAAGHGQQDVAWLEDSNFPYICL